jgi:hypothetical protein
MAEYHEGLHLIPEHMHEAVSTWIEKGEYHPVMMGTFLRAVLSNDFMRIVASADEHNTKAIVGWAHFLYNYAPAPCFGSLDKMLAWHDKHHPVSGAV